MYLFPAQTPLKFALNHPRVGFVAQVAHQLRRFSILRGRLFKHRYWTVWRFISYFG